MAGAALLAAACGDDDATVASTSTPATTPISQTTGSQTTGQADTTDATAGGSTTTVAGAPAGDDPSCAPLQVIADYDEQVARSLQPALVTLLGAAQSGDAGAALRAFDQLRQVVDEIRGEPVEQVVAAYEEVAGLLPDDLAADARALAESTPTLLDRLAEAGDADALQAAVDELESDSALQAAGQAATRLDAYARETCGFSINDG